MEQSNFTSASDEQPQPRYSDEELRGTMQRMMAPDAEKKSRGRSVINIASIAGVAILMVCFVQLLQLAGVSWAGDFSFFLTFFPFLGGALVTAVAFGLGVGDRRRYKKSLKRKAKERQALIDESFNDVRKDVSGQGFFERQWATAKDSLSLPDTLWKSRSQKLLSGVCGGLARYFSVDVRLVRVIFSFAALAGYGLSVIVYIVLAIVLEKEPAD